jgi:proteic killer suppression protein
VDTPTEHVFNDLDTKAARKLPKSLWRIIRRKLLVLDAAISLTDLAVVPGYRLEMLKGEQRGRNSIRVNDQYRITFRFESGHAHDVTCEDYH